MSKTAARLALGFALVGLAASSLAAYGHYRLLRDPSYLSFCDVSLIVSCTQVYASRFSVVGGVSVAVFGVIWFAWAALMAAAGMAGAVAARDNTAGYLFAGSTAALAGVMYLAYTSFFVLQLLCVLCLLTYASVIGIFVVSGRGAPVSFATLPGRVVSDLRVLLTRQGGLAAALVFVVASVALLAFFPRSHEAGASAGSRAAAGAAEPASAPEEERVQFAQWYAGQPHAAIDVPAEGAAVVVVKFNDYQCPPCRQTFMDYEPVFARYAAERPGAVRFVIMDFPLESECNAGVTSDLHPAGCEAAVAVRLARERGTADHLERWLFANQPRMTPALVEQGARDVGGVSDFQSRYDSALEAVKADIAYGRSLGVRATPTFFVNGVRIQGGLPVHLFEQAIAIELERASPR